MPTDFGNLQLLAYRIKLTIPEIDQGKYADAEPLLQQSLMICEKVMGPNDLNLLEPLEGLAGLFLNQGKDADAERYCRRALTICEEVLGSRHLRMCNLLSGLALACGHQGKYVEAEELYLREFTICEEQLGARTSHLGHNAKQLGRTVLHTEKVCRRCKARMAGTHD